MENKKPTTSGTGIIVAAVISAILSVIVISLFDSMGKLQGDFAVLLILKLCATAILSAGVGWVVSLFYKYKED